MNCDNCGRKIKRGYKWNGRTLGIRCYKAENPYYTDPAQAVYNAAEAVLNGDSSALASLPNVWHAPLKNINNHREAETSKHLRDNHPDAKAHPAHDTYKDLPLAYHLATIVHSYFVARKMYAMGHEIFSVGEYLRVVGRE